MLWVVLAFALVFAALGALGLAILRTWRLSVTLAKELGRASDAVAEASEGLAPPPALTGRDAARPPAGRPPAPGSDGAALARRVGRA